MSDRFLVDVRKWLDAEPFVSFRVILTSGTTYEVSSPFQLVVEEAKITFFFDRSSRLAVFRINQIVTVATLEA